MSEQSFEEMLNAPRIPCIVVYHFFQDEIHIHPDHSFRIFLV